MSFLRNVVGQMIVNMDANERHQAIREVTSQALAQMSAEERVTLTRQLFIMLLDSLEPTSRAEIAAVLAQHAASPPA